MKLGTYEFEPGAGHQVVLAASLDGAVVADAIRLVGQGTAPADIVYIHPDHLGTPQKMTDAAQAVVWDRVQDPFGQTVSLAAAGPDNPLRFPGQYADAETGLHYNFFRDYDPAVGRYVESDPIGLAGGANTYGYVLGNPATNTDPSGLDCGIDLQQLVNNAYENALNDDGTLNYKSRGQCATTVRKTINDAGGPLLPPLGNGGTPSPEKWGPPLVNSGCYREVVPGEPYTPKPGDVAITRGRNTGHISVYDGGTWNADMATTAPNPGGRRYQGSQPVIYEYVGPQ